MSSSTVSVDKKLGLTVYCLLVQARRSLDRSKLGWDPGDGFQDLQNFYEGDKRRLLLAALVELTSLINVDTNIDVAAIRARTDSSVLAKSRLLASVVSVLSRFRRRFPLHTDEVVCLAKCLKFFIDILDDVGPPSIAIAKEFVREFSLAVGILSDRFWSMPQFSLASKVEVVSPPPIGKEYSVREIISRI